MLPRRLHTAFLPAKSVSEQIIHRQTRLSAAFCTLAHRTPSFVNPTKTGNPANVNKIQSRTEQVARHLSVSSSLRQSTSHSNIEMASLPVSEKGFHGKAPSAYSVRSVAAPHTLEHRIYIEKDGVPVSPFHDIPLYANEQQTVMNMVVEIPRWTNAKAEVRAANPSSPKRYSLVMHRLTSITDLQGRDPQPNQAGYQEGKAAIRPQLLPPQGLHLELRCLPSGLCIRNRTAEANGLTKHTDLGGPQRRPPRDQGSGRQRPSRRLRDW